MKQINKNWPLVEIGDFLVKKRGSVNPKNHLEEIFELYSIPDYDQGEPSVVKGAEIGSSKKKIENGDILLSRIVPHIRRCWIIESKSINRKIGSGEWIVFSSKKVNGSYLKYFFLSDVFSVQFLKDLTGVGGSLMRAKPQIAGKIQIPLPPLPIQRQIAELLDTATALRQKTEAQLAELDRLAESVFLEMFGDPVRNEKGWEVVKLGEVCKRIIGGKSYGGEERELDVGELGVLKISAVTSGTFRPLYKVVVPKPEVDKLVFPKKGDLLFSRANTRALVAATCIVDQDYESLFLPDKLWKLELVESKVINHYLKHLLTYPAFRFELTKKATGTSGSMLNISKRKLEDTDMPVPPLDLQTHFAQIIENLEAQKAVLHRSLKESEDLVGCLLQEVFS